MIDFKVERAKAGLTQYGLSIKSDVSMSLITQIENGKANPKISTIKKLCAVFDIDWKDYYKEE